ncbi:MAG: hypothetical protein ABSH19_09030 [Opitutales bacterium]|jgi:hypothetical protein
MPSPPWGVHPQLVHRFMPDPPDNHGSWLRRELPGAKARPQPDHSYPGSFPVKNYFITILSVTLITIAFAAVLCWLFPDMKTNHAQENQAGLFLVIYVVCLSVGMACLGRSWRKKYGLTPQEMREQLRGNKYYAIFTSIAAFFIFLKVGMDILVAWGVIKK